MKSRILKTSVGSFIFLVLIIAVIALVQPVYNRMSVSLVAAERQFAARIQDSTGLSVSYESLSPSILSAISMKGIEVSDAATGKKLLGIRRAVLSYRPGKKITSLVMSGVVIEYNKNNDADVQKKVIRLIQKLQGSGTEAVKKDTGDGSIGALIQNIRALKNFRLPFDVQLKNVTLHYTDTDNDVAVTLKKASFHESPQNSGIAAESSGTVSYMNSHLMTGSRRLVTSCGFSFTGTLFPAFDGSAALLHLSGINSADLTVNKMDLLFNYSDSVFRLQTVRTIWPVSLLAQADMHRGDAHLSVSADHFNPFQLIRIKNPSAVIEKVIGMRITGNVTADAVFAPAPGEKKSLSYTVGTSVSLPENLLGSPVTLTCLCTGTTKKIEVSRLSLSGDLIGAEFSGTYTIGTRQPSGTLTVDKYTLSNGGILSTEVYIDPLASGFMCFAPQLFLGDKAYTALQLTVRPVRDSIDFTFEMDDYAHAEYDKPGHIKIDGSYLTGTNQFIQAGVVVSDMFMDSALDGAAFFLPEKKAAQIKKYASALSSFICSDELYFSSDLKQLSFNAPYCVIANTKKDHDLLVFAIDGSNQTVQLSRFDLILGGQTVHATAQADFSSGTDEAVFSGDFSVNTLPYRFSGTVSSDWLTITGDYGFDTTVSFGSDVSGSFKCSSLPLSIGTAVVTVTSDLAMSWTKRDGFNLNVIDFEAEEPTGSLSFKPKLTLAGTVNKYGFVADSIAYTDNVSVLNGSGSVLWNMNDGLFDSAHAAISASSPLTAEKFNFSGDLSNPTHVPFSLSSLMNDIYFSSETTISSFPMARFFADQSLDDTVSASCAVSGTLKNPFISVTVQNVSLALLGAPLVARGSFVMDDTGISVSNLSGSWTKFSLSDFNAQFNPQSFSGNATALFKGSVASQSVHMPFSLALHSEESEPHSLVPDHFSAVLESKSVSGSLFDKPLPFLLTLVHTPGRYDLFTGTGTGITASVQKNGKITVRSGADVPFAFSVDGSVSRSAIDVSVSNVFADLPRLSNMIDIPDISFSGGTLKGSCRLTGLPTDPEITGGFSITGFNLDAPDFLQNALKTDYVSIDIGQNGITMPDTVFRTGKGQVVVGVTIPLDRWRIAATDIHVQTPGKNFIPVDLKVPFVYYKGDANMNLKIHFETGEMEFAGSVAAQNGSFEVVTSSLQTPFSGENISASVPNNQTIDSVEKIKQSISLKCNLSLLFGQHIQVLFNPLLRGIVVPDTAVSFYYDTDSGSLSLKGDVGLRGGEIVWLNRNFYMKDGRIVFNANENNIDPHLTVRAETRERDTDGNQVRIILSAINQPISSFNPQITTSPAKSEKEIMELLGQIVSADSDNAGTLVLAGGDYLMQTTVIRQIENALRELCNFDIFSVRTMVLQNALKQGLNLNSGRSKLTVGNFFDNSTVYIGKYFGSSLYVDALLHWSYDETKLNDSATVGGLVFQPEFGLEMASPFATIRWGIAPDLEAMQNNMWVPSTSITLSWKYSF